MGTAMASRITLLIDDDGEFAELLAQSISPFEFEVRQARNGDEAVAELRDLAPALILVAVDLPDKVGFETFGQIKATGADAPVVLTTATLPPMHVQINKVSACGRARSLTVC